MQDFTIVAPTGFHTGDRVTVDPQLGSGTVVARVHAQTIWAETETDGVEDWYLVSLDNDMWAWKGTSGTTCGGQAVAFIRVLVVSASNLTCIN